MRTDIDAHLQRGLALETESEAADGRLGFVARALVQATLPHRRVEGPVFQRQNGGFTLTLLAPPDIGLPFGTIPRLVIAWVCTEVVRTRQRELELGDSLSAFMGDLGLVPTGGRWGTITRLKDQMRRLFSTTVAASFTAQPGWGSRQFRVASQYRAGHGPNLPELARDAGFGIAHRTVLWWDPVHPQQAGLWRSTVTLTTEFYDAVLDAPVPVSLEALQALKQSPMALDLYVWLTYRMSYLRGPTPVSWEALELQFGADYGRRVDFRRGFREALVKVLQVYPEARVTGVENGVELRPSPTHVLPRG